MSPVGTGVLRRVPAVGVPRDSPPVSHTPRALCLLSLCTQGLYCHLTRATTSPLRVGQGLPWVLAKGVEGSRGKRVILGPVRVR